MRNHWLIPKEVYEVLDKEFNFDFDPCPYPKPDWDGLEIQWGKVNWVNPPFLVRDGGPPVIWLKKAIDEHRKGKTIVFIASITSTDRGFWKVLLDSQIDYELRYYVVRWQHIFDKGKAKAQECLLFIIKNNGNPKV